MIDRNEAMLILIGWQKSESVISCFAGFPGCGFALKGRISELSEEEARLTSLERDASLRLVFAALSGVEYGEPKDALDSEALLAMSEADQSAGILTFYFHPIAKLHPFVNLVERPEEG